MKTSNTSTKAEFITEKPSKNGQYKPIYSLTPYGESAIVLKFENEDIGDRSLQFSLQQNTLLLHTACLQQFINKEKAKPGIYLLDCVPGKNNLTFIFNPLQNTVHYWLKELDKFCLSQLNNSHKIDDNSAQKTIEIPVVYGEAFGPDLKYIAEVHGLTPEEVINLHSNTVYTVAFLGFQPGFAYLDGLNPQLITPRRSTPRICIPANSVAIGGDHTCIYPSASPGGWHIIGRRISKDNQLFDCSRPAPCLLSPGDKVLFKAV